MTYCSRLGEDDEEDKRIKAEDSQSRIDTQENPSKGYNKLEASLSDKQ